MWPCVGLAADALNLAPQLAGLLLDLGVVGAEGIAVHRVAQQLEDFVAGGPDVAQIHVHTALALPDRLGHQVFGDVARNGVGHHQRRAGQEVGLEVGVNTGLEVAVAREHSRANQIVLGDDGIELRGKVAGVADAGGAAVAGHREAELFEILQQAGLGEVLGHDTGARCQTGLDMRRHAQARLDRLLGQQAGRQQNAGVAGVGAAGDGGNEHVAVLHQQRSFFAPGRFFAGFLARLLLCLAVIRRGVGRRGVEGAQGVGVFVEAVGAARQAEQLGEPVRHMADLDTVLRPLGPGQTGSDVAQVELDHPGVDDIGHLG